MDTAEKKTDTIPSFFDERPSDPEAPYKFDKPRKNRNSIKAILYIIGILFFTSLLASLYFLIIKPLLQNPGKTPAEVTANAGDTINSYVFWKTYTMDGLWEFKYPKGWVILAEKNEANAAVGISDTVGDSKNPNIGNVFLQVAGNRADDSFDLVFDKEVGEVEKGIKNTVIILDKQTVDGYPAVTYSLEIPADTSKDYSYSIVTLIKGPININISGLSLKSSGKADSEFIKTYVPIHKKIVSSFKFAQ